MTFIKINETLYPATISGKVADKDWNNRASKAITLEMSYADAVNTFVDDIEWFILQDVEEMIETYDEVTDEIIHKPIEKIESYDNSEYSIAGSITDHRDGTITVKMGMYTNEELLLMEVLA